jgi:Tol biopolymer transport system component
MRHIATGSNAQIMPPEEVRYTGLTFTPSGDFLYFVRIEPEKPGVGFLYAVPVLGGTPRKLVEDVDSAVSFSPDGQHMVFLRTAEGNSKIIIAQADGTGERALASLPLPGYSSPAWSPDGEWIASTVLDPGSQNLGRVVVLNATSGKEKTIYAGTASLEKATWMPDGKHLLLIFHDISSEWNGQVGEISVAGGKLYRITNDLNSYSNNTLAVTRDGKQVIAVQTLPEAGVYTMSSEPDGSAHAVQIGNHGDINVAWRPDGTLVTLDYDGHIATMNADGSARNVIYQQTLPLQGLSVCPDGVHALFQMPNKDTKAINIWRLDLQSGRAEAVTSGKVDQNPECSPDSQFFIYISLQNGKRVLMRMPLGGGQAKVLYDKLVEFGAISPDGKQIAVFTAVGSGVNFKTMVDIIPSEGGLPVKSFPPSRALSGLFRYSADGQSLYYPVTDKGVYNLVAQPIGGGTPKAVTNFTDLSIYGFDYDWKNKKLAMTRGRTDFDIVLITEQQNQ